MALLVCWDLGTEYKKSYQVVSYLNGKKAARAKLFGATMPLHGNWPECDGFRGD